MFHEFVFPKSDCPRLHLIPKVKHELFMHCEPKIFAYFNLKNIQFYHQIVFKSYQQISISKYQRINQHGNLSRHQCMFLSENTHHKGSITVQLTSCLTGFESTKQMNMLPIQQKQCAESTQNKHEVSHTVIPPLK